MLTRTAALTTWALLASGCAQTPAAADNVLVIDGETRALTGEIFCSDHSGGFAIRVAAPDDVFVALEPGGGTRVDSADLGTLTAREAEVTSNGDAYVVTGKASAAPDAPATVPFELRVTCPKRDEL